MSYLTFLSTEIIELIFKNLQLLSPGPRYISTPQTHSRVSTHHKWILSDPGPLYLVSTCKQLEEIYLPSSIAGNLVLVLPDNATRGNCHFCPPEESNGNVLRYLTRMREGIMGKKIVRFIFQVSCPLRSGGEDLGKDRVLDVMRAVVKVLGTELKVVAVHLGDNKNIQGTLKMQDLEALDNSLLRKRPISPSNPSMESNLQQGRLNWITEEQSERSTALHFYSTEIGGIPDVIFGVVTLVFLGAHPCSFSAYGGESGTWPGWMVVIFVRDEEARDQGLLKPVPPVRLLMRGIRGR